MHKFISEISCHTRHPLRISSGILIEESWLPQQPLIPLWYEDCFLQCSLMGRIIAVNSLAIPLEILTL